MENKKRRFCELKGCKSLNYNHISSQNFNQLLICKCCKGTFCSEECVIEHTIQIEKEKTLQGDSSLSLFIKPGRIVSELNLISNKYFNFENFEKVKLNNNKPKILGTGAFGEVYLIKNKIDGKFFAMKQMDKTRIQSVGIKPEVIYREISIHMSLIHDHIARLFSYHEDNKAFYLIIEYVENGTLFSVIQKNKGLTEDDAFKYFIQVASALNFLHDNNLIHRDLKPENCLIDKEGNVKLCDFGWTVDTLHGERATFCGTYEYMAPEIIKEKPYSKSIDVWSLGVLLYELIHSYSPFRIKMNQMAKHEQADPSLEVLKNILKHQYTIDKDISQDCKDLLKELLNPKNEERIPIGKIFTHSWVKKYENKIKVSLQFNEKTIKNHQIETQISTEIKNLNPKIFHHNKRSITKNNSIDSNVTIIKDVTKQNFHDKKDLLLDEILEQLEYKNKNKGPQNKIKYNFCLDNINKTIEEEIKNVNKKGEDENKVSIRNQMPSPIRQREEDFSMLSIYKDMDEIDKEISEKSRKIEKFEKKKNRIKSKIENSSQIFIDFNKDKHLSLLTMDLKNAYCLEQEKTQPQSIINSDYYNSINTIKKTIKTNDEIISRESNYLYGNTGKLNDNLIIKKNKNKLNSSFQLERKKTKNDKNNKNLKQINQDLEEVVKNKIRLSHDLSEMSQTLESPFQIEKKKTEMSVQTETDSSMWSKFLDLFNIKCG
jgi:serine/threonine protein kinase